MYPTWLKHLPLTYCILGFQKIKSSKFKTVTISTQYLGTNFLDMKCSFFFMNCSEDKKHDSIPKLKSMPLLTDFTSLIMEYQIKVFTVTTQIPYGKLP